MMHKPLALGVTASCASLMLALFFLPAASTFAGVLALRTISLTVSDLDRTERFFHDTLDFRILGRRRLEDKSQNALLSLPAGPVEVLTMQLGDQQVKFMQFKRPGRPYPGDSQSPDLWFQHFAIVVSDMDAAYARVRASSAQPISLKGPETLPERNGGVRAFKFRDPDGHPLELLWFPPGQGRPFWQARKGLFLGIDHSAIAVSSTERSLAFYEGLLGLHTANAVTNEGETQERLDGTAGAIVRITGLQTAAPEGPGIELLNYEKPATGRPATGIRVDDVAHSSISACGTVMHTEAR
jgi:catechol 2,3-dioxygenase-like lactoylglutathione lyase family enzyme